MNSSPSSVPIVFAVYGSLGVYSLALAVCVLVVYASSCLTQVFFTNLYAGCIFCLLALMAYDRYVSICKPLLYHAIMTPAKVKLMLTMVYLVLASSSAVQGYLTSRLRLCGHMVDKLVCDSLVIANLSCERTPMISVYGLCCALCVVAPPPSPVRSHFRSDHKNVGGVSEESDADKVTCYTLVLCLASSSRDVIKV
ncbi:hypothetical protein F2P81_017745 [Scophthalmus maximus]|uniref:G-protein coupled receptors family 1 profile domain-containing protein n=1 Tax=Scophthalmus maximus TaxID=52904 RepID=A0A6A4SJ67_SCOMX|nr:hypothetical protein F2P81_017745 [Scophthalmus maximus]